MMLDIFYLDVAFEWCSNSVCVMEEEVRGTLAMLDSFGQYPATQPRARVRRHS